MSSNENEIDNDIKTELLELANLVTQEFSIKNDPNDLRDFAYESFSTLDNREEKLDDLINDEYEPPIVDWKNLEIKLKQAQQEIHTQNKRASIQNDREEIRRKLAMVSSSSSSSSFAEQNQDTIISDYLRRPSASKNLIGQNMQICFMNEIADDLTDETLPEQILEPETPSVSNSFSVLSISSNDSCDTVLSQMQNEAKLALAKVPGDVRFKIQSELVNKKPSPIADIVGLPTYGLKRLERENIVDMNIGQLQVIVNDLCNQIEKINEDLKILLIDRDDLYMQQDSILVDIEDVTKRIKEYAQKYKNQNGDLAKTPSPTSKINVLSKCQQSDTSSITTQKSKLFQLSSLTNKLYRFRKKN